MTAIYKPVTLALFFSLLILPSLSFGQKDHFKAFLKAPGHDLPTRLQGNKIQLGNNGKDLYVVGELKAADPSFSNQAFVLFSDAEGAVQETYTLKSSSQSATDGVRGSSLAIDAEGAFYVGGSYTGNWDPLSMGAERTLVKLDESGKQEWGAMQPNLYFSDLLYQESQNRILGMSGPSNLLNPNYDIHVNIFSPDGKISPAFSLQTGTVDYGKAIIETPSGIAFAGTSYDAGIPQALLGFVDTDLTLNWAFHLSNPDFELEVADMSYHEEGIFGISGTATDSKNGLTQAFLIGIGTSGEVYFFNTFELGAASEGLGLKAYTHGDDRGFLLTGFYHEGKSSERKSMILKADLNGTLLWANSYSPYHAQDDTFDEVLRDITYIETEGLFAAIGDIRRYRNGQNLDRKSLIMVKGPIQDGQLNLGEDCYQVSDPIIHNRTLNKQSTGTGATQSESFTSISYQQVSLEFNTGYCSFGPARKEGPEAPGGRGLDNWGIKLDKEQLRILRTGIQSIRIEYSEKLLLNSLALEIFDLRGQSVSKVLLSPHRQNWEIQLPILSYGMYFVKISDNNLPVKIDRFILGE